MFPGDALFRLLILSFLLIFYLQTLTALSPMLVPQISS